MAPDKLNASGPARRTGPEDEPESWAMPPGLIGTESEVSPRLLWLIVAIGSIATGALLVLVLSGTV